MASPEVDLIITYVNGADAAWIRDYIRTTHTHSPTSVRYRPWGTLKYLLRGVETYMPFVRNVILIVSQPSQVPIWANTKELRVVYHDEFIPKRFLPTFNSCTIESFFWNIPGLGDKVIYLNDDMFPVAPMSIHDFFTGDTPHIKFTDLETYNLRNIFRCQCRSGIDLLTKALELSPVEKGKLFKPYHISTAITRQGFEGVKNLCANEIEQTVSTVRLAKNVNQYIYSYYYYFTNNYIDDTVSYDYFEISDDTLPSICETILNGTNKMLCLNDSDKLKNYNLVRAKLLSCFAQKFPKRSKYETRD